MHSYRFEPKTSYTFVLIATCLFFVLGTAAAVYAQSALVGSPPAVSPAQTATNIQEISRTAAIASGAASRHGSWRLTGKARFHGADQTFEMVFDSSVRFRMTKAGMLSETNGFDGAICWTGSQGEKPHPTVLQDRDVDLLVAWAINGVWANASTPLTRTITSVDGGEWKLVLTPKKGVVPATLILDATTCLPKSLRYWTDSGDEVWTFSNYRRFEGQILPTHIVHRSGEQEDSIEIASAAKIPGDAQRYHMPEPAENNVAFDTEASNRVEIKHLMGYMFVRPRVDGQDTGWFFLDTGAENSCLDPTVARKLNLAVVGSDTTAGAVGVTHLNICQATTLQLGPVTLKKPLFLEFDLAAIARAFKIPIIGICGYDLLSHVALDIAPKADTMQVFPPGAATLPAHAKWTRLRFNANTPLVTCRFAENNSGIFSIDTGSGSTVDFFTPAVEKFHLLAKQDGSKAQTGGAGGTAESRRGPIDWFELGGQRIEKPTVGFQLTKTGVFASPYLVGNIGMGFMSRFRLILDLKNERMAFAPPLDAPPGK